MDAGDLGSEHDLEPLSVDDTVSPVQSADDQIGDIIQHVDSQSLSWNESYKIARLSEDVSNASDGLNIPETEPAQQVLDLLLKHNAGETEDGNVISLSNPVGVIPGEIISSHPSDVAHVDQSAHILGQIHAVTLADGSTAFIEQKNDGPKLAEGEAILLEDGTTAYVHSSKGGLQAVQLQGGITAYIATSNGSIITDTTALPLTQLRDNNQLESEDNSHSSAGIHAVKAFACLFAGCGRVYTTQHHLKVHLRSHTGDRPFKCIMPGCEKAFASGYGLKSHTRIHTGEKPYKCPQESCDKGFKTSGDLQKHYRTHTGERPFRCPFEGCERAFTTSNIRKVHIRTHTGERPYMCTHEGCGRSFASATNYKNHVRIHSGEKPYACSVEGCEKRFTEYSSLYKHHVVHTHSKPYTCNQCGKMYRQTSTLAMHKRSMHGDDMNIDGLVSPNDDGEPPMKQQRLAVTTDVEHMSDSGGDGLIINTDTTQINIIPSAVSSNDHSSILPLQPSTSLAAVTVEGGQQIFVVGDPSQLEAIQQLTNQQQLVDLRTVAGNNVLTLTPITSKSELGGKNICSHAKYQRIAVEQELDETDITADLKYECIKTEEEDLDENVVSTDSKYAPITTEQDLDERHISTVSK